MALIVELEAVHAVQLLQCFDSQTARLFFQSLCRYAFKSSHSLTTAVDFGDGDRFIALALGRDAVALRTQTAQQLARGGIRNVPRNDGGK